MAQAAQIDLDGRGVRKTGCFVADEHLERSILGRVGQTGVV